MIQPNSWSCLATAAAIIFDISLERLIYLIGHDGSKILWPELPDPERRQGFHPQEIIQAGIYLMMPCCYLEQVPMVEQNGVAHPIKEVGALKRKFESYLAHGRAVIIGQAGPHRHAWAKTSKGIYDPSLGTTISYGEFVALGYTAESMILRF